MHLSGAAENSFSIVAGRLWKLISKRGKALFPSSLRKASPFIHRNHIAANRVQPHCRIDHISWPSLQASSCFPDISLPTSFQFFLFSGCLFHRKDIYRQNSSLNPFRFDHLDTILVRIPEILLEDLEVLLEDPVWKYWCENGNIGTEKSKQFRKIIDSEKHQRTIRQNPLPDLNVADIWQNFADFRKTVQFYLKNSRNIWMLHRYKHVDIAQRWKNEYSRPTYALVQPKTCLG